MVKPKIKNKKRRGTNLLETDLESGIQRERDWILARALSDRHEEYLVLRRDQLLCRKRVFLEELLHKRTGLVEGYV